jgi:hypothetical protein
MNATKTYREIEKHRHAMRLEGRRIDRERNERNFERAMQRQREAAAERAYFAHDLAREGR